ncbi:class I SAM-dependent methyltransferase, partial [Chloroflexota bacterium]
MEIGPGNLNLAQDLLAYFSKGTLIDYNPDVEKVYDNLSELSKRRLEFIVGDFSSITLQTEYDCVVACEVLEHIENDDEFLGLLVGVLSNRGQLVLSVPSRMKFWSKHDEIVGHIKRYEKEEIIKMLSKWRLKNINVVSYGFPFINILRWPRILLAKLQYGKKIHWDQKKQTQGSGIINATQWIDLLGIVCNPYTIYPLNMLSSLFDRYDWSNGY